MPLPLVVIDQEGEVADRHVPGVGERFEIGSVSPDQAALARGLDRDPFEDPLLVGAAEVEVGQVAVGVDHSPPWHPRAPRAHDAPHETGSDADEPGDVAIGHDAAPGHELNGSQHLLDQDVVHDRQGMPWGR